MRFPDLALARRLELHEAWSGLQHARTQARLYPETDATALPVAGGQAVYCGRQSPLNQVFGLGLSGPVRASDLVRCELFYHPRGVRVRVRACPLAAPSLLRVLGERGYSAWEFMNVYFRSLQAAHQAPPIQTELEVRVASPEEAQAWFERAGSAGDWAEPDGVTFMTIRCALKEGSRLFLAWRDGQPIGGGGLEVHDGVGALVAASTLPAFRRQGVHTALLHARLVAAAEAGCDLALIHTRPGAASGRNVLRAGFQLAYTAVGFVSPAQSSPQSL